MNRKDQMLYDIGVVDFVLVELGLYLDTHPHDSQALEYYNHYCTVKNQLETDFAAKYYPLKMSQAAGGKCWRWGDAPLPWEGGC